MKATATKRSKAYEGEDCEYCGYPFDEGDDVIVIDDHYVYCSRACLLSHEGIRTDQSTGCSWAEPTDSPDPVADADLLCPEPIGGAQC